MPWWELKVYEKDRLENWSYGKPVKAFGGGQGYVTKVKHLIKILFMTLNIHWVEVYFAYVKYTHLKWLIHWVLINVYIHIYICMCVYICLYNHNSSKAHVHYRNISLFSGAVIYTIHSHPRQPLIRFLTLQISCASSKFCINGIPLHFMVGRIKAFQRCPYLYPQNLWLS